jgi:putative ABC transport system permease protein
VRAPQPWGKVAVVNAIRTMMAALRLAFRAVARSKLRASLTVLGILIGVAAVVLVTALGTGARERIAQQIEDMGSNTLYIFPQPTQTSGAKSKGLGRLTEADGRAILRDAPSVVGLAPFSSTQAQVVFGDRNTATTLMGSNLSYFPVRKFAVARGSAWTEADERSKAKVVILGVRVVEHLFGNQDPIGAVVRIGRHPYRVIGVLAPKGPSPFGEDQDDRILLPGSTFRARIRPAGVDRVDMLIASASSAETVERAQRQIEQILRQRHSIVDPEPADFAIRTQAEFRRTQEGIYMILSALLLSVAAVSLFVGGIGVMNIMLVSVTERTREIGIRMAIGAQEGDILLQFLVEAVVLSLLGGLAGTLLALGAIYGFSKALEWPMRLPSEALLLALATSVSIGVVFGFLPARRAARLDPIEALRQD